MFLTLKTTLKIGEGGFGEVFKGKWRGTTVAVKTLKGANVCDPKEVSKFVKEVTVLRFSLILFLLLYVIIYFSFLNQ